MADICDTCAFEDACPSAHFHPTRKNICADYKTIKKNVFILPGTDGIFINGNLYNKKSLCLDWFRMSNDAFFDLYGFNFNPHEYPGLYEWGRKVLYEEEK